MGMQMNNALRARTNPYSPFVASAVIVLATDTLQISAEPHLPLHKDTCNPHRTEKQYAAGSTTHDATSQRTSVSTYMSAPRQVAGANTLHLPASAPIEAHFPDTTLVKPQFELELHSFPDKTFVQGILESIVNGVNIGYVGPHIRGHSRNLKSADEHPEVVDRELAKECNKGHIAGPYDDPPFPYLHCSGLGVVAKKNGGWRMIMHLSAPPGRSINDFIPKDDFTLSYSSVDDAVSLVKQLGPQSRMAKVNLKSAFRMCPVRKEDWHLLGMKWKDKYYVDKRLPFGLRSAPFIFNTFASTIKYILKNNYNIEHTIHYLDDYFIVGPPELPTCRKAVNTMLTVCKDLGVPVAMEKLEGPATNITFLGISINTTSMTLSLPPEKLAELVEELERWPGQKKCTKRQLLAAFHLQQRSSPQGDYFSVDS